MTSATGEPNDSVGNQAAGPQAKGYWIAVTAFEGDCGQSLFPVVREGNECGRSGELETCPGGVRLSSN